jgi:hypothetical protein
MASCRHLPVAQLLICAVILGVVSYTDGQVLFSKLPNTLLVTASLPGGGSITGLASSAPGSSSNKRNLCSLELIINEFW